MSIKDAKKQYEAAVEDLAECQRRLDEYTNLEEPSIAQWVEGENAFHDLAMAKTRLWEAKEALKAAEEMQRESLRPKKSEEVKQK